MYFHSSYYRFYDHYTIFASFSVVVSNRWFSNRSCTMDVGLVKLSSDSFCRNRVFKMNAEFCCHLCYSISMILDTILFNIRRSLSLGCGFRPPFLLACDVFPWFVYAVIALETTGLDTPIKWPFWLQMLQLNAHQKSVPFKIWQVSNFAVFSYELY